MGSAAGHCCPEDHGGRGAFPVVGPVVIDEVRVLGSRCGPFPAAIALLSERAIDVEALVDARFPLADGVAAFARAQTAGTFKVLLKIAD